jgi:hypothetical protein
VVEGGGLIVERDVNARIADKLDELERLECLSQRREGERPGCLTSTF